MNFESLSITPLTTSLGAEIRGVNLAEITASDAPSIRELLNQHKVLFFPEQSLSVAEHVAFGAFFGELQGHPHYENPITKHDQIFELAASHGGVADEWHSDITFRPAPALFSILKMVTCPAIGGDTLWTNPELAYESLTPPLRNLCNGLTALHTAEAHGRPDVMAVHPVVRVHPDTGKHCLFVNEHFTKRIVELSFEESEHWLGYLTRWIGQTRFSVRYRWQAGTIAMWDNRCTQHKVLNDFNEERVIQRVTVMGDQPEGETSSWPAFTKTENASDTSRYDAPLQAFLARSAEDTDD